MRAPGLFCHHTSQMSHFHHLRSRPCPRRAPCPVHPPGHVHSIDSVLDILEGDHALPPVHDHGVLESIVSNKACEDCQFEPETRVKVTRRTTYTTPTPCRSPCPDHWTIMKRRNSTWADTIRRYLTRVTSKSPSRRRKLKEIYAHYHVPTPQTEKELDKFLLCVWGNPVCGPTVKLDQRTYLEIQELKDFYDTKLQELKQDYKVHLSQLAHLADTSCRSDDRQLLKVVKEEKRKVKCFDRLRFNLKEQVAAAILQLIPESLSISKRVSCKAFRIMTRWYEEHAHHPYPTARQKQSLARRCAITVEQVSNWFSRERAWRRCPKRCARSRRKRRRKRKRRCGCKGILNGKVRRKGKNEVIIRRHVRRRIYL